MAQSLEFTGERFVPECGREIWYEHWHRYALACDFAKGARVLDVACGEGYGSALLARHASEVTGFDVAPEAIEHARRRYGDRENLSFEQADCTKLPVDDGSVDLVACFETLEHVEAQESMLREFRRVLRADGLLLVSSPDRKTYSDDTGYDNPYHVKELYRDEFLELLTANFAHVRMLGQKLLFQSVIWDEEGAATRPPGVFAWSEGQEISAGPVPAYAPVYHIGVCSNAKEAIRACDTGLWLFGDAEESVYRHYDDEVRRNIHARDVLQAYEQQISDLKAQLADVPGTQDSRGARGLLTKLTALFRKA